MYPLVHSPEDDCATDLRARAMARLGAAEAPFARLIDIYGAADPFVFHDGGRTTGNLFAALSLHIISQRIQAMVGFRIYDRVAALTGGAPTAATVLEAGEAGLASCGLSAAKVHYMLAFAARVNSGDLDFAVVEGEGDEEAIADLTRTPGIGTWTAQTFLIHQLHRPDILPSGEPNLRQAIAGAWELDEPPTPAKVREMGEAWRPYRSFAAALLWRSLYPPGEPSDQKERALLKMEPDRRKR